MADRIPAPENVGDLRSTVSPARACLLALRRTEPDLVSGAYRTISTDHGVLTFARGDSLTVSINLGAEQAPSGLAPGEGTIRPRG